MIIFNQTYCSRKVLITGHTGFKGCWLTSWLLKLGANVVGFSNSIPTTPSMFDLLDLRTKIKHVIGDIRDPVAVRNIIESEKPDFIFHLAAQPIVSVSYVDPCLTVQTNVVGTMNVLEALRDSSRECVVVFITSDKCYDNVEWVWGYRETDALGGHDIYSGSKACAEIVIKSYYHSFFKNNHQVRIGIGRAGNVIGGGDWAKDRILPDCMRAWSSGTVVEIRCPNATRPWQHVLEPLSGYLTLAKDLLDRESMHGEAFNFGPYADQSTTVAQLLSDLVEHWSVRGMLGSGFKITGNIPFQEAGLLKLNCDKALYHLKWQPRLKYSQMIQFVGEWYSDYYNCSFDMFNKTITQITEYEDSNGGCGKY